MDCPACEIELEFSKADPECGIMHDYLVCPECGYTERAYDDRNDPDTIHAERQEGLR